MEIGAKVEYGKLKELVKNMSKEYIVKVGLLADKGGSEERAEDLDNAGLGAIQEFGADIKITPKMAAYLAITAKELGLPKLEKEGDGYVHIPPRSFLQMPLTRKNAVLKEFRKLFKGKDLEELIYHFGKTGDLMSLAVLLGASAVEVVKQAFQTQGFGQWAPNSPYTIAAKGSANPLQDTGELWQKIDFEVEKR